MHWGWPSPSLPQLLHESSPIPMTNDDGSWMAVMPCIGAAFGSVIGAFSVDRIGRKTGVLLTAPLYFISWIIVAFSPSVLLLNIARFLAGTADGLAFTAFPMYLGELADSKIRGLLGSSIPLTMTIGILLINVIGSCLDITKTALVSSIVPILLLATFTFMPESPYFLIMKNLEEDARKSLQILKGTQEVSVELNRLNLVVKEDLEQTGRIWDLFTVPSNRKSVIIVAGLRAAQQFSGVNAITFYAQSIFEEAQISPSLVTNVFFLLQLIVSILASFLVDKTGRRPLPIVSIIGSGVALAAEGLYFLFGQNLVSNNSLRYLPVVVLLIYVVVFNLGMGTIPVLMLGEVFPTSVKAFALCLADIYFGILVTVVSKFFQIMKDDLGMHVPFFAFTVCCALGMIFFILIVPETKGKTLEEIQQDLKGKKCPNLA